MLQLNSSQKPIPDCSLVLQKRNLQETGLFTLFLSLKNVSSSYGENRCGQKRRFQFDETERFDDFLPHYISRLSCLYLVLGNKLINVQLLSQPDQNSNEMNCLQCYIKDDTLLKAQPCVQTEVFTKSQQTGTLEHEERQWQQASFKCFRSLVLFLKGSNDIKPMGRKSSSHTATDRGIKIWQKDRFE